MPTLPPTLTPAPATPNKANRATYDALSIAFDDWERVSMIPQLQLVGNSAYDNAVESNTSAINAAASSVSAVAAANFKGNWSALTGALNMPASVAHNGNFWVLNTNLANVTTATPGVSASWTFLNVGAGGALESTSAVDITLTNLSFKVQSVTMTAADKSVTLPSATGLPAGGELFVVKNSGSIAFSVRSNGGKMLTQVDGGQTCMLHLANVSTAAGVWVVGHVDDVALTQTLFQAVATTINAAASTRIAVCKMSATQAIAIWSAVAGIQACTLNLTGNAVSAGAVLTVFGSGTSNINPIAITSLSATQAVAVFPATSSFLNACTLNVSGTTLTNGTLLVVNGVSTSGTSLATVSSTVAVVSYVGTTSFAQACTLSASGTTLTNGAIVSLNAATTSDTSVAVLSATQIVFSYTQSGSVGGASATLSGTTLTNGADCLLHPGATPLKASLVAVSSTEALMAVAHSTGTFVRVVNVIAGNLLETGAAYGAARPGQGNQTVISLRKINQKQHCLVDFVDVNTSAAQRWQPRIQIVGLKAASVVFSPASHIKNSLVAAPFGDAAPMTDNLVLAVYLEFSGFVQARVLEIGA